MILLRVGERELCHTME